MTIDIKATIRAAVDILTREADSLRECHTWARDPDDWSGEEDTKAAYDHELSIAGALADIPAIFDAQAAEIAQAKGQIEFLDRQNTGLRDQHSRDSKTLREYAQARDDLRKERDRLREALAKVRQVIAADRQALLDTHGDGTEIPAADDLGTLMLYEYDGALHAIDAAFAQEQGES